MNIQNILEELIDIRDTLEGNMNDAYIQIENLIEVLQHEIEKEATEN